MRVLHYTAARALDRAADLIETKGWAHGANARADDDSPCAPTNPVAACFCTQGAIMRGVADLTGCGQLLVTNTTTRYDHIYLTAKRALARDLGLPSDEISSLSAWNDKHAPCADYVAHMMRRAAYLIRLRVRMRRRPELLAHREGRNAV